MTHAAVCIGFYCICHQLKQLFALGIQLIHLIGLSHAIVICMKADWGIFPIAVVTLSMDRNL